VVESTVGFESTARIAERKIGNLHVFRKIFTRVRWKVKVFLMKKGKKAHEIVFIGTLKAEITKYR